MKAMRMRLQKWKAKKRSLSRIYSYSRGRENTFQTQVLVKDVENVYSPPPQKKTYAMQSELKCLPHS